MATTLTSRQRRLLQAPHIAHLATLMPDGSPQVTPVWVDNDGAFVLVNTAKGRVKHQNVLRDPRVALSATDRDDPYTKVLVRGRVAEVTPEGAPGHIHALARRYLGHDYPYRTDDRVLLRIRPLHVRD